MLSSGLAFLELLGKFSHLVPSFREVADFCMCLHHHRGNRDAAYLLDSLQMSSGTKSWKAPQANVATNC